MCLIQDTYRPSRTVLKKATIIYRAERFSPNNVENDRKVLFLTAEALRQKGYDVTELREEDIAEGKRIPECSVIFTMARSGETLLDIDGFLRENKDTRVINATSGIRKCGDRLALAGEMTALSIPFPSEEGEEGYWLKRSKGTAEVAADTVFCRTQDEIDAAVEAFHERGILEIARQAHIKGDLVKFYGVAHTPFFHHIYPTDTGKSKFGNEVINGKAHHYDFSISALQESVNRLAAHIGVCVYGGDAIVKEDGSFFIIDFNDWPSFSPCREEAAKAIASLAELDKI